MQSLTLVYDPDCGFCTRSAHWVESRWDPSTGHAVGSWDLADVQLAAWGIERARVLAEVCLVEHHGSTRRVLGGSDAVAAALAHTRGWSHLVGRLLAAPGLRQLARRAYPVVARHRHRLPGASPACRRPSDPAPPAPRPGSRHPEDRRAT